MLGVDESGDAAVLLALCDCMQCERRLARGFGSVDLRHPSPRIAPDTESGVEQYRTGGDDPHAGIPPVRAELHERALAELLLYLKTCGLERLRLLLDARILCLGVVGRFLCHMVLHGNNGSLPLLPQGAHSCFREKKRKSGIVQIIVSATGLGGQGRIIFVFWNRVLS